MDFAMLSADELAALSFETALERLETVVAALEAGRLPLEQALAAYQLGTALREHCRARLSAAEGALESLRESAGVVTPVEREELP
ncbi:MAG: exodeoxyribonuclease VII small subunit [Fimbriimonadaceae bacterium]|nr:exodeoxyribonuclease VII small subunit [Fimbriimonadaceae bacterium]